jgi:hypothetical protein
VAIGAWGEPSTNGTTNARIGWVAIGVNRPRMWGWGMASGEWRVGSGEWRVARRRGVKKVGCVLRTRLMGQPSTNGGLGNGEWGEPSTNGTTNTRMGWVAIGEWGVASGGNSAARRRGVKKVGCVLRTRLMGQPSTNAGLGNGEWGEPSTNGTTNTRMGWVAIGAWGVAIGGNSATRRRGVKKVGCVLRTRLLGQPSTNVGVGNGEWGEPSTNGTTNARMGWVASGDWGVASGGNWATRRRGVKKVGCVLRTRLLGQPSTNGTTNMGIELQQDWRYYLVVPPSNKDVCSLSCVLCPVFFVLCPVSCVSLFFPYSWSQSWYPSATSARAATDPRCHGAAARAGPGRCA